LKRVEENNVLHENKNQIDFDTTQNLSTFKQTNHSFTPTLRQSFSKTGLKTGVTFIEAPVKTELKTRYLSKLPQGHMPTSYELLSDKIKDVDTYNKDIDFYNEL